MADLTHDKLREQIALAIHKQDCMNVNWQGDHCKGEISQPQYGTADAVLEAIWPEIEKRNAMLRQIVLMMNDDWEDIPHKIEEILNG